jgi:hypothetical protein
LGDMVFPPQSDWPAETSDLGDTVSPSQSDWPAKCQTRYLELGDMVFPPQSDWPAETSDPIPLSWVTWCPHLSLTGQLRCQTQYH